MFSGEIPETAVRYFVAPSVGSDAVFSASNEISLALVSYRVSSVDSLVGS